MPYIVPELRQYYRTVVRALKRKPPTDPGTLNYLLTQVCRAYLVGDQSYREYNDVIGALECAKLEMYRRRVASYEDVKCGMNGDVF